jgi:hypothetical protein
VGKKASVRRAIGEQAAIPPSIPSAPTFKALLREIFVMTIPPKVNHGKYTRNGKALMPLNLPDIFISTIH